jgi:hypothetical protein
LIGIRRTDYLIEVPSPGNLFVIESAGELIRLEVDGMAHPEPYEKDPVDVISPGRWGFDLTDYLDDGVTVDTATVAVTDDEGDVDVTSAMVVGGVEVASPYVSAEFQAGEDGHFYKAAFTMVRSDGRPLRRAFPIAVRDPLPVS